MPVYSMTGFANASAKTPFVGEDAVPSQANPSASTAQASFSVELRSVNGRFLDLGFRMPDDLRGMEPTLREMLTSALRRGKVELRINATRESDSAWPEPQPEQLMRLARVESTVQAWLPKAQPLSVHEAMNWCKGGNSSEKPDEWVLAAMRQCIEGLLRAREREGAKLVEVLLDRIGRLRELANQAEPLLPIVVQKQQQRFLERWQEALTSTGMAQTLPQQALQERALNEAAAYAIRIDVAEELARLRAHLDELTRLLNAGGEIGKRLDFLIQELQREANTLGSKSAALELTNISVEMKVLVEQLREQVQNIE